MCHASTQRRVTDASTRHGCVDASTNALDTFELLGIKWIIAQTWNRTLNKARTVAIGIMRIERWISAKDALRQAPDARVKLSTNSGLLAANSCKARSKFATQSKQPVMYASVLWCTSCLFNRESLPRAVEA